MMGLNLKKNKADNMKHLVGVAKSLVANVNHPSVRTPKGRRKLCIKGGKEKAIEKSLKNMNACSLCGSFDHNKRRCPKSFPCSSAGNVGFCSPFWSNDYLQILVSDTLPKFLALVFSRFFFGDDGPTSDCLVLRENGVVWIVGEIVGKIRLANDGSWWLVFEVTKFADDGVFGLEEMKDLEFAYPVTGFVDR
ncbi:hypothetical protein Tco_0719950 [Tanacetum coccineum]